MSLRSLFVLGLPLASLILPVPRISSAKAEEPSGLLATLKEERLILAGKLQAEIENSLANARRLMGHNPTQAEQDLKSSLDDLTRSPNVEPEFRSQLRRQLETAIRQARQRKVETDEHLALSKDREAALGELRRMSEHTESQQQKIQQIVDRFNALLDERRFSVASEQVAPEVERLAPGSSIESSLFAAGSAMRAVNENESTMRWRNDNFGQTLANVESAAVPFSDDRPVTYLPLETWQEITNQREKYKSVDLHRSGRAEQRILSELHKTTSLDVVEMPLREVVNYLSELHNIPIVLSAKKLDEAGIRPDTPVTKTLRGITLRSALRLLLKDLELTYLIQDEVIQITTPDDASTQLTTKVYPVGDLVVPVQPPLNPLSPGGMGPMNGGSNMNGPFNQLNPAMPQMNGPRPAFPNPGVNIF